MAIPVTGILVAVPGVLDRNGRVPDLMTQAAMEIRVALTGSAGARGVYGGGSGGTGDDNTGSGAARCAGIPVVPYTP